MIEKVTTVAVIIIALSLSNELAADPPVANGRGSTLQFEFIDGTVITGCIDMKEITIQIASGDALKVPVASITELSVVSKGRAKPQISIQAGKNTIVGTVTVNTFSIASPYGLVDAKLKDIHRIRPGSRSVSVKGGQWNVQLRDKTQLMCIAVTQSLRIKTRYGTMVVPLARIQHCTFAATGKPSSVQCRNSDRIVGLFGPKTTISFKVDKSKNADILISKIAAIVACDALVFDLGLGKGVTMKLVFVPAGKFMMGSLKTEAFRSKDEGPLREVTISKPFYMGVYEVTQAQWYTVMGTKPWKDRIDSKAGVDKAASCVNWKDAAKFCEILSKKTGKKVTLPTEAQWEYACRAGSKTTYCYSDDALKLGDYAWYSANAYRKGEMYAHAVGRLKPNVFGLYDMHGNVWEWCRDWYEEKFYAKAKNIDPENTTKPRIVCRVLRGGSWFVDPENCRSAVRSRISTVLRDGCIGFRVVVSPDTGAFGSRRQNIK